ncbi:hypothetical protein ACFOVU_28430 [Nocardiopsis sediminis]|uniref:RING-type E3 ubiquitin transferase n=1 Tax=Nocardiopsis sediminis TaxID=1778267 RepID=A0ABV8FXK3_9ACTN
MIMLVIIGVLGILILARARQVGSVASAAEGTKVRGVAETLGLAEAYPVTRRCAVRGRVVPADGEGTGEAPLSEEKSVWWRVRIHPRSRYSRSGIFLARTETSQRPFDLVEGDRRIRVEPDPEMAHGDTITGYAEEQHPQAFVDRKTPMTDLVKARFPAVREELSGLDIRKVDFTEWRVPEDAEATVVGWLTFDPTTNEPVIRARRSADDEPLLSISMGADTGATEIRGQNRKSLTIGWAFIVFGFGLLLFGLPAFLSDLAG